MKTSVVIPAAGAGSRLGGVAKALLPQREGTGTFLSAIFVTARRAGVDDAWVVVGPPHGEEVAMHARQLGLGVIVNSQPERGMASSIALGFASLPADVEAAFLWPVDHPDVTVATLHALIAARRSHIVARPTYQGRGGHPPLIGRELFAALSTCADLDGGARTVLAATDMIDVAVDDPGCVRDIDTPADMEAR